uniref:DNA-dependent protein kinase catalytic subunit n=2 Tax=Cacopsylla melanoneura TaxID=428564 RepID=A0A8D9ANP8_9HEMI
MMHYYSSEIQLCTSHTQFIITTLMEGITHESDTEVRGFSARLLAELIVWSRKQARSRDLIGDTKLNMKAVVKQIQEFCVHPSSSKRIGAAIAFNNIYKVLREEVLFIDEHWLELFFYFVHNLVLCDSPGDHQVLCESFNHLNRVVKEKSQIFNATNSTRRRPARFEYGLTLDSFLQYLCEKLTHSNAFLRSVVRKIITDLSPHASNFTLETELPRIQSLIECQLFQTDLTQTELSQTDVFQKDVTCFNIALENYLWLMSESKQITQIITDMALSPQSKLCESLNFYLKLLNNLKQGETLELPAYKNGNTDQNVSQLVLSILKLSYKMDVRALDMTSTDKHLFGENYCRLVAKCLFEPYEYHYNEEQEKELSSALLG